MQASERLDILGKFRNSVKFKNGLRFKSVFSPNYSTELKNIPKSKLEDFKSSKTFLKGPRAETCHILKSKTVNLGGSFGYLEILEVQGFNQFSLGYSCFLLTKDLD